MLDFIRRFRPYLAACMPRFAQAAIGAIIVAATQGALILLIKPVLDGVFIEGDRHLHMILPPVIVGLYLIQGLARYLHTYQLAWIGEDIVRRLRDRLLGHLLDMELGFFTQARGGELISRTTNDIARIRLAVSQHLAIVTREAFVVVALIAVAVYRDPLLSFYGLVALPAAAWPVSRLARRVKLFSHRSQEKDSDITSRLTEIFNNVEIIKAHHSEDFELERFKRDNLEFRRINMRGVRARELVTPLMELLGAIAVAMVIWFGGNMIIEGRMTAGEFTSFASALLMLYTPVKRISIFYNKLFDGVAASERIFALLEREPEITSGELIPGERVQRLDFDEVSLSYGDTVALREVSLSLKTGDSVALVGDSGGGKSSLVNLLLRLYDPSSGSVLVNGVDLREIDLEWMKGRVGLVTQRVYIFNDTVVANVAYGREPDRARVRDVLEQAQAMDFVSGLEHGIDTVLDEFGANLSGGQRQRLAIARAIYKNPDVLILDEATSALDNQSEAAVQRALAGLLDDRITLVIAHRLSTIGLTDRVVVLAGGVMVGAGSHDELMAGCAEYQHLVAAGEDRRSRG